MEATNLLAGFITRSELADQLGITQRTVSNYENLPDGLPSVRIGKLKRYRVDSVAAWIAAREKSRNPRRRRSA